ncbi:hypothetical protein [Butyrivibrio fibrisolvens]|uniref:Lipoprotein n=1 Tax=Butyrivibrio fibrisolvens TaxID=831 RepID=A0A317G283_BUTFI|nr:hypothetical protein [Butyrivibrio fibrisolvens]PWT27617.1 hypothetical protein CPT75_11190 [Butyrivibrio fibrisolvens]
MKKNICLLYIISLMCIVSGCGDIAPSSRTTSLSPTVGDVLEAGIEAEDSKNTTSEQNDYESENSTSFQDAASDNAASNMDSQDIASSDNSASGRSSGVNENAPLPESVDDSVVLGNSEEGIDIDLTNASATVVYSEVYDMMYFPENYVGKTIKMDGLFTYYYDEAMDKYYFACIIMDATACCSQGIEFELTDDYVYPDDYPEDGGDICVVGTFDTYEEDGFTYCVLRDARLC